MTYKLGLENSVLIVESGARIPARFEDGKVVVLDEHSPFVHSFEAWVEAGNVPLPADLIEPPVPQPSEVRQLTDLLVAKGVLTAAESETFEQGPTDIKK